MSNQELQQLRDLPIEGVAERLGLHVVRHKSLCPFHEDRHPSLSYNVRKNTYRCFVCGASGGTIDLVMNHLHLDFRAACRWLADANSIIIQQWQPAPQLPPPATFDPSRYERFFQHPWLSDEALRFLYQERHLDPRVIRWCRITSWRDRQGTPWLQTPYYDRQAKLIGIQNRRLAPAALEPAPSAPSSVPFSAPSSVPFSRTMCESSAAPSPAPRFRFPAGSRCTIYNLPVLNLLRPSEPLYITEGCSDCWAMLSSGHKAIAIPSATLLNPNDLTILRTLHDQGTPFHMYPDNDAPGERLFMQLQQYLPNIIHHHLPPDCKDYGEYYRQMIKS